MVLLLEHLRAPKRWRPLVNCSKRIALSHSGFWCSFNCFYFLFLIRQSVILTPTLFARENLGLRVSWQATSSRLSHLASFSTFQGFLVFKYPIHSNIFIEKHSSKESIHSALIMFYEDYCTFSEFTDFGEKINTKINYLKYFMYYQVRIQQDLISTYLLKIFSFLYPQGHSSTSDHRSHPNHGLGDSKLQNLLNDSSIWSQVELHLKNKKGTHIAKWKHVL